MLLTFASSLNQNLKFNQQTKHKEKSKYKIHIKVIQMQDLVLQQWLHENKSSSAR